MRPGRTHGNGRRRKPATTALPTGVDCYRCGRKIPGRPTWRRGKPLCPTCGDPDA